MRRNGGGIVKSVMKYLKSIKCLYITITKKKEEKKEKNACEIAVCL